MRCVHVLRKPLSEGTVAANVLRHGTGALNIDATRIGTIGGSNQPSGMDRLNEANARAGYRPNTYTKGEPSVPPTGGRWPANLVLQHLDGCVQEGTRKVKVIGATAHRKEHKTHSWASVGTQPHEHAGFRDPDGTETVTAWACAPGCPVAALDRQSGTSQSAAGTVKYVRAETSGWRHRGGSFTPGHTWEAQGYGDSGGASRFFKQVKS